VLGAAGPAVASASLTVVIDRSEEARTSGVFVVADYSSTTDPAFTVERGGSVIGSQSPAVPPPPPPQPPAPASAPFARCCAGLVLLAGDVIRVTSPESFVMTFDGRPAFDASVCGSPTTFSGLRSNAQTGVTFVGARLPGADPYSGIGFVDAIVSSLVGEQFAGTFSRALTPEHVVAVETRQRLDDTTVYSGFARVVGACPPAAGAPPAQPQTLSRPRDTCAASARRWSACPAAWACGPNRDRVVG
jgi:hypothetical protein